MKHSPSGGNLSENQSATGSNYKPYSMKDYKKMQNEKLAKNKLGGLGANIGSDEWERANQKKIAQ
eukprot:CAMPEP_0176357362 /NCGR_PEP_ID=MMETSP0126-20121128/14719_1 /TAXON_ID=141414 ORGANISM="Strombidinopsis acuminatum, Strain SPMC142" /NCGR_SAMPLE_ID=MMETSP0126 /ASSEMBLY_ACC=CAM_ASM_000229 /LENGTH=64 /DNA_ID=CAMNT_0017710937 /DNA_START=1285 /DNA_END=1479 /DNA_ORIENTATION=+